MRWKAKSASDKAASREKMEFFSRVRADVPVIRQQGTPPEKDATTFSRHRCDLCNASFPQNELKQCTLCGRWACSSCWTSEYYICNSCNGVVRLHLLSPSQQGKQSD